MYGNKKLTEIAAISILLFYPLSGCIYVFSGSNITFRSEVLELPNGAKRLVTKVIDGDTFVIEGGCSVRIIGIDADERGYPCYEAAKRRLEELILDKEVVLIRGTRNLDCYNRYLRHVFIDGRNVGLILVKEGLAVARFYPGEVKYKKEIVEAERYARGNKIGCKWSDKKINTLSLEKRRIKYKRLTPELTGLHVIDACCANSYFDKEVIIEGEVVDSYRSEKNNVFLNFGRPYPYHCFTAVIFSTSLHKFVEKPEEYYLKKVVRIRGKIKRYKNAPQIILEENSQIEVGE